jgi:hypothetical protein
VHNSNSQAGRCLLALPVVLVASSAWAGARFDNAFAARIESHFKGLKAAVLLEDGLPGQALGTSSVRSSVTVKIVDGGAWEQKKFLGVKLSTTGVLGRGELLAVREIDVKKDGINIKTDTALARLSVERTSKGEIETLDRQALDFEFRFSDAHLATSDENFKVIVGAVEKYLRLFGKLAEARAAAPEILGPGKTPKAAGGQAPANGESDRLRQQLEALIGPPHYWNLAAFLNLRRGMTCDDVKQIHPTLKTAECKEENYSWPTASAGTQPLLAGYKFTFHDGRLEDAALLFKRTLDKAVFKRVSGQLLQAKWGAKAPADLEDNVITWSTLDDGLGQRSYSVDHWEIRNGLNRRGGRPLSGAPIQDAERLATELAAFLGPSTIWTFEPFESLRAGATCERVAEHIPDLDLQTCNATDNATVEVLVQGDPLVSHYELEFQSGRLREITVAIQRYIRKGLFHETSSRLCQAKWGPKEPADVASAVVTWSGDYRTNAMAQRSYRLDHWELSTRLPESNGRAAR